MGWLSKMGVWLTKKAATLGVKKFFSPSLQFGDVDLDPIRRPGDNVNEAGAAVFTIDVENVGMKAARKCRPYFRLQGTFDTEDIPKFVEAMGDQMSEFEADKIEFDLETQVFWSDHVQPEHHWDEDVDVGANPEKTIASGETSTLTFAMIIGGLDGSAPRIRFPGKDGFDSSVVPNLEIDGQPYSPGGVGHPERPEHISVEIPVDQLRNYFWSDARLYVTSENSTRADCEIEFVYGDESLTIRPR